MENVRVVSYGNDVIGRRLAEHILTKEVVENDWRKSIQLSLFQLYRMLAHFSVAASTALISAVLIFPSSSW